VGQPIGLLRRARTRPVSTPVVIEAVESIPSQWSPTPIVPSSGSDGNVQSGAARGASGQDLSVAPFPSSNGLSFLPNVQLVDEHRLGLGRGACTRGSKNCGYDRLEKGSGSVCELSIDGRGGPHISQSTRPPTSGPMINRTLWDRTETPIPAIKKGVAMALATLCPGPSEPNTSQIRRATMPPTNEASPQTDKLYLTLRFLHGSL